jgi:hypothetical protein
MTMDERDLMLDGNAAAGVLREIFAVEMTTAHGTCAGCGAVHAFAETHVYAQGPGVVARCPSCESVVLRVVSAEGRAWLDLQGLRSLELKV